MEAGSHGDIGVPTLLHQLVHFDRTIVGPGQMEADIVSVCTIMVDLIDDRYQIVVGQLDVGHLLGIRQYFPEAHCERVDIGGRRERVALDALRGEPADGQAVVVVLAVLVHEAGRVRHLNGHRLVVHDHVARGYVPVGQLVQLEVGAGRGNVAADLQQFFHSEWESIISSLGSPKNSINQDVLLKNNILTSRKSLFDYSRIENMNRDELEASQEGDHL